MLLTLTTTVEPATDLGFLLHKHPGKAQAFPVSAGTAHVFYPRADAGECTAALLLDLDPLALSRESFVNDRPYAAGSLLAVALGAVFGSALKGRCEQRPELVDVAIPLTVRLPTLACHGADAFRPAEARDNTADALRPAEARDDAAALVERLFAPLGWQVEATAVPLDPAFPGWGDSRYLDTTLTGELRLADALTHLYVLLPALDGDKHYWVGPDEVDKLLRAGERWLAGHPDRTLITERYLAHRRPYVRSALERLAESDDVAVEVLDNALAEPVERSVSLAEQRRGGVLAVLRAAGARRVLDLGCGGGALLRDLLADPAFTEIVGTDVSSRALDVAERRLDRLPAHQRDRLALRQSALTYADTSLAGYDAAVLMEVIEHVDPERLPALENAVFGVARPGTVVVTTPNVEHNVRYPTLEPGRMRHPDHRFEWTRAQFRAWAAGVAARRGYTVAHLPVGVDDPEVGPPTQLATFTRDDAVLFPTSTITAPVPATPTVGEHS